MQANDGHVSLDGLHIDPLEDSILLSTPQEGDNEASLIKKFLIRLLIELHRAGELSFKTEEYVKKVARIYSLRATCVILPASATIVFHSDHMNSSSSESYSLNIRGGFNWSKLVQLEQLCASICGREERKFSDVMIRLYAILEEPPLYVY